MCRNTGREYQSKQGSKVMCIKCDECGAGVPFQQVRIRCLVRWPVAGWSNCCDACWEKYTAEKLADRKLAEDKQRKERADEFRRWYLRHENSPGLEELIARLYGTEAISSQ